METIVIFATLVIVFWSSIAIIKGSLNSTISKGAKVWENELTIWELEADDKLSKRKAELKQRIQSSDKEVL